MSIVANCILSCEELDKIQGLEAIYKLILRKDENGCFYLDTRNGGGGGGSSSFASIPAFQIEAGQEGGFQNDLLIGSTDWMVRHVNTLLTSDDFSVDPVTGEFTKEGDPFNIGDEVQIFITY